MALNKEIYQKFDPLAYLAIKLYSRFLRCLSLRTCLSIGRACGNLLFIVDKRHREIAMTNLRFAFGGEKDENAIQSIARSHFQKLGMTGHEWLRFIYIKKSGLEKICSNVTVEGKEHLDAAKKRNKAVILLSAHFGNFEYAHIYYATHINRLNFIVRRLDNPHLERERLDYNRKAGVNILYRENGLRPAIKRLKKGEDLVIFPDRKASLQEGIPTLFFGKKTSTISVACALSEKYDIPLVPMFITRCKESARHQITFYPMFRVADLGEEAVQKGTQLQNDAIENAIREWPDQWLWIHRKWKCYHSHIYD